MTNPIIAYVDAVFSRFLFRVAPLDSNGYTVPLHGLENFGNPGTQTGPTNPFFVGAPDTRATAQTLAATINSTFAIALANGQATLGVELTGLTASGAVLTVQGSKDGGQHWYSKNAIIPPSGALVGTVAVDGPLSIDVAGLTNVQLLVTTAGTGSITVSYSASTATGIVSLGAALPPGGNVIGGVNTIPQAAGTGTDASANKPAALAAELASGTVAHAGQLYIMNQSAATIQLILNPGANQTVILIAPGAGANAQGGDWQAAANMPWFVGTFQVWGAAGSQIAVNYN